jgi:hypothetical protein
VLAEKRGDLFRFPQTPLLSPPQFDHYMLYADDTEEKRKEPVSPPSLPESRL